MTRNRNNMNIFIASIGFGIITLFAGGCSSNRPAPAEQQERINQSGHGVDTNAFDSVSSELAVTSILDQIELLYSLTGLHNVQELKSELKGHLFAALDIIEANERLFPSTVSAVQRNRDFIAGTACRQASLPVDPNVIKVSLGSPLRHSEAELVRLTKNVPSTNVHAFERMVLDSELADLGFYLNFTQRTGEDFDRANSRIAAYLSSWLTAADFYIDFFPESEYAQRIQDDRSYRAAKEWRKHVKVTFK